MSRPELAVVIPTLEEAARLPLLLADLARCGPLALERLVVDGGSGDGTAAAARLAGARVLVSEPGRGRQLAAGVAATTAPWLLLLHADTRLPPDWPALVAAAINAPGPPCAWYFDLAIEGAGPALRLVEAAVALRSRWRQLPYGDQGLLLPRTLLAAAGGVPPLPLMEDLALVQRLQPMARLRPLAGRIRVDGRRWQRLGVVGTALANWRLRRDWRRGVAVDRLAARYGEYQNAQRCCRGSSSHPWAW